MDQATKDFIKLEAHFAMQNRDLIDAWDRVHSALESAKTSHNSTMPKCDPCCNMYDDCKYRVDDSHGVAHYPPCGRTSA